jgi:hypothetical protein
MNTYLELKKKQQKEVNEFPMIFAFSQKQLEEGMKRLEIISTDELFKSSCGMLYRKKDSKMLHEMIERHSKEMEDAIKGDTKGNGFIFEMFNYELANQEYCITGDVFDTLDSLGITFEEVEKDEALKTGLRLAIAMQRNG